MPRRAADRLRRLLRTCPAVLVYGPRQCGKSTLARTVCPDWRELDLERPRDAELVRADPEAFLAAHPRRVVLDEIQRAPELFPVLRHVLDRPGAKGRFLLTGSSPALTVRGLRQAMADLGAKKGWIVTGTGERRAAGRDVEIVPWDDLVNGAVDLGLHLGRGVRR